jgi:hypothetical protein
LKRIKVSLKDLKEKIDNVSRPGGVGALKKEIDRITKGA